MPMSWAATSTRRAVQAELDAFARSLGVQLERTTDTYDSLVRAAQVGRPERQSRAPLTDAPPMLPMMNDGRTAPPVSPDRVRLR